jgi:hypothetical protein
MAHFVICPSLFRIYTYSIHFLSRLTYCTYILCFFPFWSCQRSLQIPPSFTVDPLSFHANCYLTYTLYILIAKLLPYCIFSQPNTHSTVYSPHPTVYYPYPIVYSPTQTLTLLYILATQLYILPPKYSPYYISSQPTTYSTVSSPHQNSYPTVYVPPKLYMLPTQTITLLCMFRPSCISSLPKLLPYCISHS